jgi:hypothetical protein
LTPLGHVSDSAASGAACGPPWDPIGGGEGIDFRGAWLHARWFLVTFDPAPLLEERTRFEMLKVQRRGQRSLRRPQATPSPPTIQRKAGADMIDHRVCAT